MANRSHIARATMRWASRDRYRLAPWAMTSNVLLSQEDSNDVLSVEWSCYRKRSLENRNGHSLVSLGTFALWRVLAKYLVVFVIGNGSHSE